MKIILAALFAAGCAVQPHYEWIDLYRPAERMVWWQLTPEQHDRIVGHANLARTAPMIDDGLCHVYSRYSETEAHWIKDWDGMSVYDHEMRHCMGGAHPNQG